MPSPTDPGSKGYRSYGQWLRQRYAGHRVFKVIVDAGFTCPNRDGSKGHGGCTYCNVDSFTPSLPRSLDDIREQVAQGMERARKHYAADRFIIYFQPNTNTYAPVDQLQQYFDQALAVCPENIVGLAVGTRPDCLDAQKIALLESYADRFDVDLELGMESVHDRTLAQLNRGCTHADLVTVLDSLAKSPLNLCVHTIFGLPGETPDMWFAHANELNRFPQIRFAKLHHLQVVRGSVLGARYQKCPFPLFDLAGYADFLCELLPRLRPDLILQRLFSVADTGLLLAPLWPQSKVAIQAYLDGEIARRGIVQGSHW